MGPSSCDPPDDCNTTTYDESLDNGCYCCFAAADDDVDGECVVAVVSLMDQSLCVYTFYWPPSTSRHHQERATGSDVAAAAEA